MPENQNSCEEQTGHHFRRCRDGIQPTTESSGKDGMSNVVLTRLHLDRLGPYGQMLRRIGLLSTCYVMNARPMSHASS